MQVNITGNVAGKRPNIWMKIKILEDRISELTKSIAECKKMQTLYYETRQYEAYERETEEIERLGLLLKENQEVLSDLKISSISLH